jgi:hypothetical protein
MHAVRPIGEDERTEEDRDADDDESVREVERRPGDEIEEVRDVAEPNAIDEVRDAPSQHETESNGEHGVAAPRACEEHEHGADCDRRHDDDDRCPAAKETECDPRVLNVVDGERPDDASIQMLSQRAG